MDFLPVVVVGAIVGFLIYTMRRGTTSIETRYPSWDQPKSLPKEDIARIKRKRELYKTSVAIAEAVQTNDQDYSSSSPREPLLWTPTGPVHARIPDDTKLTLCGLPTTGLQELSPKEWGWWNPAKTCEQCRRLAPDPF